MGTPVWLERSGTGSTPGTTAGRGAWTSSALRLGKSMSGSRDSLMSMCHISGHPDVFVTLMVVTDPTSFPRTSTDGSGAPTKPGLLQQTAEQLSMIGQDSLNNYKRIIIYYLFIICHKISNRRLGYNQINTNFDASRVFICIL